MQLDGKTSVSVGIYNMSFVHPCSPKSVISSKILATRPLTGTEQPFVALLRGWKSYASAHAQNCEENTASLSLSDRTVNTPTAFYQVSLTAVQCTIGGFLTCA